MGGSLMFQSRSTTTDTPLGSSTTDTTMTTVIFNGSRFWGAEQQHELGIDMSATISDTATQGTDSSSLIFGTHLYYHFNHAVTERLTIYSGAGFGVTLTDNTTSSSGAGGFPSFFWTSSTNLSIEIPVGFKVFLDEHASVNIEPKLIFESGGDSDGNTTSTTGFGFTTGFSYYF